jgi:trehalose 6-phosphate synthase/phosphatase
LAGGRWIVASNRLPTTLSLEKGEIRVQPSSGGLAAALAGLRTTTPMVWIGWPGSALPRTRQAGVADRLAQDGNFPVFLTSEQQDHYYQGFCNSVLWPLFHYFIGRVSYHPEAWREYVEVNRLFCETILAHAGERDRVWIHDFHLMLVPSMLRERLPNLEIGFFLHIPFPSAEVYRILPVREDLLRGVLGADYIGFHTGDYGRHFRNACLRVLGLESEPGTISYEGRQIGIGADPIGVDVAAFRQSLASPEAAAVHRELVQRYEGRKLILGVERLDYTKGIALKLQAYERFLERDPARVHDVVYLQVLVPSRLENPRYGRLKSELEELVGRINGTYARPGQTPVEYLHRSLSHAELTALYRFADAAMISSVRDGMNLVAQEFVLCQGEPGPGPSRKGSLILSEFAGAAQHLPWALIVNPWNLEQCADAIEQALASTTQEREERMKTMHDSVLQMDCRAWATTFVRRLDSWAERRRACAPPRPLVQEEALRLKTRFAASSDRTLILDYDGTIQALGRVPDEARPKPETLDLLARLCAAPRTEVHLVSGRKAQTLDAWFGQLPMHLAAEHGYLHRARSGRWKAMLELDLSWMDSVSEMLRDAARETPGTFVEQKSAGVAWHYRMADLDYGVWRARELRSQLEQELANLPVEVLSGHQVIEVRAAGVNKGRYVRQLLAQAKEGSWFAHRPPPFILCAGDDRTDQDMFRALPSWAISIQVGVPQGDATYSVESPRALRGFLRQLLDGLPSG